jgi:predicted DNA-binding transcriptional regulator AlpA
MTDAIVERLDALIAATRTAHLDRWLTAEDVGALLGYSPAQIRERIACRPGFPKPLRVDGGHPRWKASEIQAWAEAERERTGGRKRRAP